MAGSIGITPDQFWGLTPYELHLYAQGVGEKRDRDMSALAWMQANLINVHIGKGRKVRAEQLYRSRDAAPEFLDAASFNAYMRKRKGEED